MTDYSILFHPRSIAVIGASNSLEKLGGIVMNNLSKSYSGTIFPINPRPGDVFGVNSYNSLIELPNRPDLAIIALNAELSVKALKDSAENKIPFAIIFAGGFSEIGNSELEDKLSNICQETEIKLIGPNCMGIWNRNGMNASFMNILPPFPGKVTFISQSGSLIAFSIYLKLRLGKFISLGNSVNINFDDFFEYLSFDPDTKVLAMYIESLQNGRSFLEKIKNFKKPVIVIKAGNSEYGQRSISSHTGALAGNAELYKHLFKAYGILSVKSFDLLVAGSRILELSRPMKNNKIIALSNAGGAVCLFSDACFENNINPDILPDKLKKELEGIFPPQAPVNNPLDLTVTGGSPKSVEKVMNLLFDTTLHNYGAIIYIPVVAPFIDPNKEAELVIKLHKKSSLPFIACLLAGEKVRPIIEKLDKAEVPYTQTIQETAEVLKLLWDWSKKNKG
jgi:acyl-CoA synthetase (NDP forming)